MEHRKHWEYAQILLGLEQLEVLDRDAMVLAVAAGQEELLFELTNRTRWAFATDIYGSGPFAEREADMAMLRDPDSVARCSYNRRRLVVQCMDALDLRYEDDTFDAVYGLSSLEHFGGAGWCPHSTGGAVQGGEGRRHCGVHHRGHHQRRR